MFRGDICCFRVTCIAKGMSVFQLKIKLKILSLKVFFQAKIHLKKYVTLEMTYVNSEIFCTLYLYQGYSFIQVRKRAVIIHVSDKFGNRLQGASITLQQVSKDFPFGSAISQNILANFAYQV